MTGSQPLLETVRQHLAGTPFVSEGVERLLARHGSVYAAAAETHLRALLVHLNGEMERLLDACDVFVEMTFETLRLQEGYYRTGRFSVFGDAAKRAAIYDDQDLMQGRYLTGLFLAQVLWQNHFEKLMFFREAFLPRLAEKAFVLDVGTGPGTYALLASAAHPGITAMCNDITPYSRPMVQGLVKTIAPNKVDSIEYAQGDFTALFADEQNRFDAIIFSEVVEHLDDPELGMRTVDRLLRPDGIVFFTTATNAAFYDHTIVFENIQAIENLLQRHGFEVLDHREVIAMKGPFGRDVVDYNAVIRAAGAEYG